MTPEHSPARRPGAPSPRAGAGALAAALLVAWIMVCHAPAAQGGRADYVGAQVCRSCHPDQYRAWQASAHARAGAALSQTSQTSQTSGSPAARCLACHTTGEAPAGQPLLGGVQCEACHGPGAGYATDDVMRDPALARHMGLRDLSTPAARAALCAGCHRASTRLLPFDPEAALQRLPHP